MKNEKLLTALGQIDDRFISEAAPKSVKNTSKKVTSNAENLVTKVTDKNTHKPSHANRKWRYAAAAACVCLIFALGFMLLNGAFGGAPSSGIEPIPGPGGNFTGVDRTPEPGGDSQSTNSDNNSSTIIESTPVDTDTSDGQEGTGGDSLRWTNYKYEDRLTSIDRNWSIYVTEKTGKTLDELWKTEWKTEEGAPYSLIDIIYELDIPREMFVEDNNKKIAKLRENDWDYLTDEVIFRDYCFTDEEIDAIYSRDKKRIAEAFAFPYAVVADNWELYPLRWIIDNPATLYKEREISLEAIQKSVDKIIEDGLVKNADKEALLARIEEYKELQ